MVEASGGMEEIEADPTAPIFDALLARIDAERRRAIGSDARREAASGGFVVHRFGRTLETGEAEVASRAFFDASDRPPVSLWIETLGRADAHATGEFEVAVLAFVPADCLERAAAGSRACPSGAVILFDPDARPSTPVLSATLSRQLAEILREGGAG